VLAGCLCVSSSGLHESVILKKLEGLKSAPLYHADAIALEKNSRDFLGKFQSNDVIESLHNATRTLRSNQSYG
jgi:hypothetical protein